MGDGIARWRPCSFGTASVPYVGRFGYVERGGVPTRSERGAMLHKVAAVLVVLILAAGVAAQQDLIPTFDSAEPSADLPSQPPASGPGLTFETPQTVSPVLDDVGGQARVTAAGVRALLGSSVDDKALGQHFGLIVARLGAAKPVLQLGQPDLVTPASTLKLLTTVAALHGLGPDHRFETQVVRGRSRQSIVLVGGGDPLLTGASLKPGAATATYPLPASLQDLARKTAAQLKDRGTRRVQLGYDASLFTGPAVNPHWEPTYIGDSVVSPDHGALGRRRPPGPGARTPRGRPGRRGSCKVCDVPFQGRCQCARCGEGRACASSGEPTGGCRVADAGADRAAHHRSERQRRC